MVEPDIMVVRRDAPGADLLHEPPLLVLEVLSPSTRSEDAGRKRELYAEGGADWYWLVDPDSDTVTILERRGAVFVERPFRVTLLLSALFA